MRSPVTVFERREKSGSWHRDAMAAYKSRRPERGGRTKRSRRQRQAGGNDKPATSLSGVDGTAPVYQLPVTRRSGRPLVLSLPAIWFITGHGDTNVHTASPDNLREHK